jgi:hypothetical protein
MKKIIDILRFILGFEEIKIKPYHNFDENKNFGQKPKDQPKKHQNHQK